MKLGIMQPYFLPYVGYWQLMNTVDRFVVYDDVNYIKGGWVNRNRILINGEVRYITLPLNQASPYKRICDIALDASPIWREKIIKTLEMTYRRTPFFYDVFPLIEEIIKFDTLDLSEYLVHQLKAVAAYLGIHTPIIASSRIYGNHDLSGQERVIDICKREKTLIYINAIGGRELYSRESFENNGLQLKFLQAELKSYTQFRQEFEPGLSIVDLMMFNDRGQLQYQLANFRLI